MFADVALNVPLRAGDRVFTFAVPPVLQSQIGVGTPVRIPFGRATTTGFVVKVGSEAPRPARSIAAIDDRVPSLPADLVSLAWWMAEHYVCSVGEALQAMLPPRSRLPRAARSRMAPGNESGVGRGEIAAPPIIAEETSHKASAEEGESPQDSTGIAALLTTRPQARIAVIGEDARFEAYGSALQWAAQRDAGVIVLVPEVSQAGRLASWVTRRTGRPVGLLSGDLPDQERWETWRRIRAGEITTVVGTRVAVFAPLPSVALIIIDHEEDTSYKEERVPRYHARRVAEERARVTGASIVWGTPAPSLEVVQAIESQKATSIMLPSPDRPTVAISDVRAEAGPLGGLFGRHLYQALARTLPQGRAIIFVPRRGYADFVLCHECGSVPRCPRCGIAMTYHTLDGTARGRSRRTELRCHLCGTTEPVPEVCPVCGGTHLKPHGIGTERVEQAARRLFRRSPVFRLDTDVAPDERSQQRIWQQFATRGGLLIGTQLLVKGVGRVPASVVGAMGVDAGLYLPDFRATERMYQILVRLTRLAQREMIIQTFSPSNPALVAVARQDGSKFYRAELTARQRFGYPPFRTLVNLVFTGTESASARGAAQQMATALADGAEILGPSPAPLARIRGRYRWQVLLKEREDGITRLHLADLLTTLKLPKSVRLTVDVDPIELL